MKQCPSSKSEFLWNDLHLSKGSSFPNRSVVIGDGSLTVKRAPCAGVKVILKFLHEIN